MDGWKDRAWTPAIGAFGFVALWWLVFQTGWVDPVLLPSPWEALKAIWDGFLGGTLINDFVITVRRTLLAFAIAAAISVPLGIILGSSPPLYRSCEFVIDFFRSTPASALFPLFLVILGVGEGTKVAVAAFGASLLILFNTAYGVMNARKTRQAAAKVMGASPGRVMVEVTLLESLPQTFVGMRTGISFTLTPRDRRRLEAIVHDRNAPQKHVWRAEIVLHSADGLGTAEIMRRTGKSKTCVWRWQER